MWGTSLPNQTKYLRDGIFVLFRVLTQSLAQKLVHRRSTHVGMGVGMHAPDTPVNLH